MIYSLTKFRVAAIAGLGLILVGVAAQALSSSAFVSRAGFVAASVCPAGSSQDYSCLEANGALSFDSSVDDSKAKELAAKGTCPCLAGGGGTVTVTIPSGSTGTVVDAVVNHQAIAAWAFKSVSVRAFTRDGAPIASTTFVTGVAPGGFAQFKTGLKNFIGASRQKGGVEFRFATGPMRL